MMERCCETCRHDLGGGYNMKQSRYCLRQARPARANPADSSAALPPTRFAWAAVRNCSINLESECASGDYEAWEPKEE